MDDFFGVAGKGDGDGGHATGLHDEQESPTVQEGDGGMEGVFEIGILAAEVGTEGGEFGVDECASEGGKAAEDPSAEDEWGGVDLPGDNIGIDKDAGADDAAHDDHGDVKDAEAADERFVTVG